MKFWLRTGPAFVLLLIFFASSTLPSGIDQQADVTVYIGEGLQTYINTEISFKAWAFSPDGSVFKYDWDFDGDGLFDYSSSTPGASYIYPHPGFYYLTLKATDVHGRIGFGYMRVKVQEGAGTTQMLPRQKITSMPNTNTTVMNADGHQTNYAILLTGSYTGWWNYILDLYNVLINNYNYDPGNIYVLLADSGTPETSPEIVYGRAARDTIENVISAIASNMDDDDLFLFFVEWHGNGYLGYDPEDPDNIALHGFFGVPPLMSQPGDELDFPESNIEMSLFCAAGGLKDGRDFHYGIGEWGVLYYPNFKLKRTKVLSHFTDIFVESLGLISDNDVYLERFTDYTLGDINQNGSIETALGEVWDWDGDGNSPWDRETGVFDEDDWGNIDSFEDDCPYYSWHTGLPSVNYYVFDANLDDHADIDIDPGDTLEVDGTDIDNNGCIDYMDLNDDGDLDDWITLNETMSIYMGTLTDDEIRDYFDWIQHGTRIFITNTCYGGGFIDDLSSGRTIVMSGSKDISRSSAGFITRLMTQAFGIYSNEADTDGSGRVSIVEAFNHASIHPQTGCALGMDYFQYDDNADALPHEDPLPASGDGYLGSAIFLADALTSAGETSSYALKLNQNHPNPFNPRTTISFILPKTAHATLSIFNAEGKLITSLIDKTLDLGRHEITWNGTDSGNNSVASGIYFYRLLADGKILTRKMVLLK